MATDPNLWKELVCGIGLGLIVIVCAVRIYIEARPDYLVAVEVRPSNIKLLLYRVAVLAFFVVVWIIRINSSNWFNLNYYTYWNFTLQIVYLSAVIVYQARHWANIQVNAARGLNILHDVMLSSCFLVTLVFWILLFDPKKPPSDFATYIVHLANLVLLLIEFAANEFVVQRSSLKYLVLWPTLYSILTWIGNVTYLDGFWPYDLMDLNKSLAPVIWFGIILAHVVCFCIALLLSKLKRHWSLLAAPLMPPELMETTATGAMSSVHIQIVTPPATATSFDGSKV
ncbi:unnamed protein product [Aphanomyces euteiches]|nr:hypothetical protein AeRB84_018619 [Aphanomyces euteiches]